MESSAGVASLWLPSLPTQSQESMPRSLRLDDDFASISTISHELASYPYDPRLWFRRALVLTRLWYPELATGDLYKSRQLLQYIRQHQRQNTRHVLGHRCGFWMVDPANDVIRDNKFLDELDTDISTYYALNMCDAPYHWAGAYIPREYPWTPEAYRTRSEKLITQINQEFSERSRDNDDPTAPPYCVLRPHALPATRDAVLLDNSDILGVFANRDIDQGVTVLRDESQTIGCDAVCSDSTTRCSDCNEAFEQTNQHGESLRWLQDKLEDIASPGKVMLLCQFLLRCVPSRPSSSRSESEGKHPTVQAIHPLEHDLVARMTANYNYDPEPKSSGHNFDLEGDIGVPNALLGRLNVDIFADQRFDTWVLFTLRARIRNNRWSDPNHVGVHPLFSLFNNACDPNLDWTSRSSSAARRTANHRCLTVVARRKIHRGEQLFVEYNGYIAHEPLRERRRQLRGWLAGDCMCEKCMREEEEERTKAGQVKCRNLWGVDAKERPVLPEDLLPNFEHDRSSVVGSHANVRGAGS